MYFFKSCSKCRGDMKLGTDIEGDWFVHCLNCGFTVDLARRMEPVASSKAS